ncbi:MAG: SLBB domain-containing protein [Bacteroidota bacterium]
MKCFCIIFLVLCIFSVAFMWAQTDESSTLRKSQAELVQAINVTVGGDFIITGSFTASRMQRLDYFITTLFTKVQDRAFSGINQLATRNQIIKDMNRYALRDITLKRANGDQFKVDLLKFRLTGDFKYNPYLMNDDVIIIPSYDDEKSTIEISGAVNNTTKFQFVEGDKLSDAVLFAGGINSSYENVEKAEISRLDNTGNKENLIVVNVKDDIVLKCGDRIRILADENQRKNYKVRVIGEVRYPGYIYVAKSGSLLSEVIRKAGGFTINADLRRAEVIRDYNAIEIWQRSQFTTNIEEQWIKLHQIKVLEMLRHANLSEGDSLFFSIDNELRILRSENLVDFTKLNDPESEESKYNVQDGDFIVVPAKFDYVYVFGQVAKVGYIKYAPGKDYTYYIEKTGGLAETARNGEDDIVVIKGKEMNWVTKDIKNVQIESGDYIYVPKKIPVSGWIYLKRIGDVLGIAGSIATIILLFIQFNK